MSVTEVLLERNAVHVAEHPGRTAALEPTLRALVLTCADHRVDPAHILGIQLNEAVVLRNAGGRVTPEVLHELALLVTIAAIEELGSGFELILLQHTDCGIARLGGPEHQNLLAGYFGIAPEDVPGRDVMHPVAAVQIDVEQLRESLHSVNASSLRPCLRREQRPRDGGLGSGTTWRFSLRVLAVVPPGGTSSVRTGSPVNQGGS